LREAIEPRGKIMWRTQSKDRMLNHIKQQHFHYTCLQPFMGEHVITQELQSGARIEFEVAEVCE